jgi:hypothetical protein
MIRVSLHEAGRHIRVLIVRVNSYEEEGTVSRALVVGLDGGELIQLGPVQIRILEDGTTTGHRLGLAEIRLPRGAQGLHVVSGTVRFDGDNGP